MDPSQRRVRAAQDDNTEEGCVDEEEVGEGVQGAGGVGRVVFYGEGGGDGMAVSRPFGNSQRYDVLVEAGGRIVRVQVKSTIYKRRGNEYSLNVMGPQRKKYKAGTVDFFAVYLIPEEEWYIIPYEALGEHLNAAFCGRRRGKA